MGLSPCLKFVIGRTLTILSWDNPVTAFFRKSKKLRHSLGRPSRSDFVQLKFVAFRCHSRFCPTCGNKYSMERTTNMSFKLINVQHRHCVFTIDENLRDFFLQDRSLLNCLFHAVTSVVLRMFHKQNKSKNYTPGFIMVLHTFGLSLIHI